MADEQKDVSNAGDNKDADKGKAGVSFESQEALDQFVDKIYTRAFKKAEEKYGEIQKQLDEIKQSAKPAADNKDASKKADDNKDAKEPAKDAKAGKKKDEAGPEVDVILARLEEQQRVIEEIRKDKEAAEKRARDIEQRTRESQLRDEFFRVAEKVGNSIGNGFFDINDVFSLARPELDVDEEGSVVVMNPKTKQPRQTANGNMTLEQFLTDFAKAKPQMVRAKNSDGGSGAGESRKTDTKDKKETVDYSKMSREDFLNFSNGVMGKQYTDRR